ATISTSNVQTKTAATISIQNIKTNPPMIKKPAMPNKPASTVPTQNVQEKSVMENKSAASIPTKSVQTKPAMISKSSAPNQGAKEKEPDTTNNKTNSKLSQKLKSAKKKFIIATALLLLLIALFIILPTIFGVLLKDYLAIVLGIFGSLLLIGVPLYGVFLNKLFKKLR
ncbi:hypothetical protein PBK173_000515800, partial [Plasmodium berghei]